MEYPPESCLIYSCLRNIVLFCLSFRTNQKQNCEHSFYGEIKQLRWDSSDLLFFFLDYFLQERIPVEEVFEQLKCTREGLTSEEGANRLQIFGPNKLEEKKVYYQSATTHTYTNIHNITRFLFIIFLLNDDLFI